MNPVERERLLVGVLERPSTSPTYRSAVQRALSRHALDQGDYQRAAEFAAASVELERGLGQPAALARSLSMYGYCRQALGDPSTAVEYFRDALRTAEEADPPRDTFPHRQRLLEALVEAGRPIEAAAVLAELLPVLREREPSPLLGAALHSAGRLALLNQDLDTAGRRFTEALSRQPDDDVAVAGNLEGLAIVAVARDSPACGLRLAATAAGIRERLGTAASPGWRQRVDSARGRGRAALGARRAATAEAVGRQLPVAAAVAAALGRGTAGYPGASLTAGPLTQRETEVAGLVAEGLANRQIASRLGVSQRTVEAHLERVREKLQLSSRVQVALWFTRQHDGFR